MDKRHVQVWYIFQKRRTVNTCPFYQAILMSDFGFDKKYTLLFLLSLLGCKNHCCQGLSTGLLVLPQGLKYIFYNIGCRHGYFVYHSQVPSVRGSWANYGCRQNWSTHMPAVNCHRSNRI